MKSYVSVDYPRTSRLKKFGASRRDFQLLIPFQLEWFWWKEINETQNNTRNPYQSEKLECIKNNFPFAVSVLVQGV